MLVEERKRALLQAFHKPCYANGACVSNGSQVFATTPQKNLEEWINRENRGVYTL
jgi:hypothetical protein